MTHTTASKLVTVDNLMTFESKLVNEKLPNDILFDACDCGVALDKEVFDLFECCPACGSKEPLFGSPGGLPGSLHRFPATDPLSVVDDLSDVGSTLGTVPPSDSDSESDDDL